MTRFISLGALALLGWALSAQAVVVDKFDCSMQEQTFTKEGVVKEGEWFPVSSVRAPINLLREWKVNGNQLISNASTYIASVNAVNRSHPVDSYDNISQIYLTVILRETKGADGHSRFEQRLCLGDAYQKMSGSQDDVHYGGDFCSHNEAAEGEESRWHEAQVVNGQIELDTQWLKPLIYVNHDGTRVVFECDYAGKVN